MFDSHARVDEKHGQSGAVLPYLRIAVTNEHRKATAEDVEVLITEIEEFATGSVGSGGRKVWLANPALAWANSHFLRTHMTIPAGATRYLDVGAWIQATPLDFALAVIPEPASGRHRLPAGGWHLDLAVTMRNGDASFWRADVSFEESVQKGLGEPARVKTSIVPLARA